MTISNATDIVTTEAEAVTLAENESQHVETEVVPALESVELPLDMLRAALSCASDEEARYYLCGVYIHRVEDRVRMVATDGHRLFIGAYQPSGLDEGASLPAWLDSGVILSSNGLGAKLALISKLSDIPLVRLSYACGTPRAVLTDMSEEATFRLSVVDGTFPDYQALMGSMTGGVTETADIARSDFQPVSFNGRYLKAVGDLAKILAGKGAKDDGLMAVSVFAQEASGPALMTFASTPGALLVLMPMRAANTHAETVALMAPAIRGTVAALRAHKTRNEEAAEATDDPIEKQRFTERAADYQRRIDDLMARTLERPALPAPDAEQANGVTDGEPLGTEHQEVEYSDIADGELVAITGGTMDAPVAEPSPLEDTQVERDPSAGESIQQDDEPDAQPARAVSRKERRRQRQAGQDRKAA